MSKVYEKYERNNREEQEIKRGRVREKERKHEIRWGEEKGARC